MIRGPFYKRGPPISTFYSKNAVSIDFPACVPPEMSPFFDTVRARLRNFPAFFSFCQKNFFDLLFLRSDCIIIVFIYRV